MTDTTIQLIGVITSAVTSISMIAGVIAALVMLRPQRRQIEVETDLNQVKLMEANQAEYRAQLAETREELAKMRRQGHEKAIEDEKATRVRNDEREAQGARIAALETANEIVTGELGAARQATQRLKQDLDVETKARLELERKYNDLKRQYHELKAQYDALVEENAALMTKLAKKGTGPLADKDEPGENADGKPGSKAEEKAT